MRRLWAASACAVLATATALGGAQAKTVVGGFGAVAPTGQRLTPEAAAGALFQPLKPGLPGAPEFEAGQAAATALSPDGRTLAILTSGFNRTFGPDGTPDPALSQEYVFLYDVSGPAPVKRQVLTIPDSFLGLAWSPTGERLYVSGGVDDDVVEFARGPSGFAKARIFPLGHKAGLGIDVKPEAAGLAVSPDGRRLLVADLQNEAVSLIDLASGRVVAETDLRPGVLDPRRRGAVGGTFPRTVAWTSDAKAYVAVERDRELVALNVGPASLGVGARLRTRGQPVALLADLARGRLFAALDNTDAVLVIDPVRDAVVQSIATGAQGGAGPSSGVGTDNLALSPDGRTLYVSNGGENAVAAVRLGAGGAATVAGRIPTGWYPTALAVSADGGRLYVVNGKSNPGPNPGGCRNSFGVAPDSDHACRAANQYVWQLEKAGFLTLPTPAPPELARLTAQVAANNVPRVSPEAARTMAFLRGRIRHVIYVVKENRTYDQVLGDLEVGNGDPRLELFPASIAPNHHALARQFVDLDAFRDSGETSNTGWNWTTAARTTDFTEREAPVNYAQRGLQYDQEGQNRDVNVAIPTSAARHAARAKSPDDPDLLAGTADVAAPDGPEGEEGRGYVWDAALKAGLSVRNWGFYGDLSRYDPKEIDAIPPERDPFRADLKVFYPTKPSLAALTDLYYRGFDQGFPDFWRVREWRREFDGFVRKGSAPSLMLMRLPHDHFGRFGQGIDGVDTVETEMADNDYGLGQMVEAVARSPFARDTLIFVVEDDAQDGPDHVDAHRSIAFVIGPYVRRQAVVSTPYTTVNLVRTLEEVLGLPPLNLNDARAAPMADLFDPAQGPAWSFTAEVPAALRATKLPLPPARVATTDPACAAVAGRSSAYWARVMERQDFNAEDRLDTPAFNLALWRGLKGEAAAYPAIRDGADLSRDPALRRLERGADPCRGRAAGPR